ALAPTHRMTIVPGLEINCDVEGAEIHVLGYFVDHEAAWFQEFLREQRAERVARVHRIAERLAELGLPLGPPEAFAGCNKGSPGRPRVGQVVVRRGCVKWGRGASDKSLKRGGVPNVPRRRLTPVEAVQVIRKAHGVPVFAHPGLADRDAIISELVDAGLMGIETYYAEHSAAQTNEYLELCRRFDLVPTGGSDYHGPQSGGSNPLGSPAVPW